MIVTQKMPEAYMPDFMDLVRKVARKSERSVRSLLDEHSELKSYLYINDIFGSSDAMLVGVWAQRVVDGYITFDDIYRKMHTFEAPESRITVPYYVAYHLLGIPFDQWESWREIPLVARRPHYIRRVIDIGRAHGVNFTSTDMSALYYQLISVPDYSKRSRIQGVRRHPALDVVEAYIRFLAGIQRAGYNYNFIPNPTDWWAENWSPEAAVRFANLQVSLDQVKSLEAQGVSGSDMIVKVLFDGMPLEWAIEACRARDR